MIEKDQLPLGSDRGHFSNLSALFISCTLKISPEISHTEGLMKKSMEIMAKHGVTTELIRAVDYEIAPSVQPDMTKHGFDRDDWPTLSEKVTAADIFVLGTPIWLGEKSSVCSRVIERLYSESGRTNGLGQYIYYGKAGGCIMTGNEDGIKHCSMNILYSLQHLGYFNSPAGRSRLDRRGRPRTVVPRRRLPSEKNEFTQRFDLEPDVSWFDA
jgi:multimeric flavodoxin WrbA